MGQTYTDPKLVLFSGSFPSACGQASAATGPFYCPSDQKVYLDMAFFQQMKDQFGASGDFAQAYVIAHEVGHHVQDLLGILPKFNQARRTMNEVDANKMSVRIELQADCFAGIWGKFTQQKGILQAGDLEEALNAAQQIGDDTLQKRTQGYVVPDSFNHGTSAQRMKWFKQGFDSGKLSDCDTLNNPV
jgi:predicted metalloprotease